MKTIQPLILLAIIALFTACEFNQSVHKDLLTGEYTRGDGIGCDEIAIEIDGEIDKRNIFVFGENVNIIFNDVTGLKKVNGRTHPVITMNIIKNDKDTVFFAPNLLEDLENGTDLSPLKLEASFIAAVPNQNNEKYKVHIDITDKKGDGSFHYELPFTVKKNDLLDIESNGVDYTVVYLWDETTEEAVLDKNISAEHSYSLILNGVDGLDVTDGKVFPILSLDIEDNEGNKILSEPNLLSAYEETGVNPEDLKSQVSANVSFTEGKIYNPCTLTVSLKDKNSSKEINVSAELNVR